MSTLLTNLAEVLVAGIPLLLLVARFLWPRYFPWWAIFVGSGIASWALYEVQVSLRDGVLLDEQAECLASAANDPPPGRDCPIPLVHYLNTPIYLRWVAGMVWLGIFLPLYGLAHIVRSRRRRVAA
jgi:hypothetical protein